MAEYKHLSDCSLHNGPAYQLGLCDCGEGDKMADEKSNVVDLDCATLLDIPAEKMLTAAIDANLKHILIIGEDQDGEEHLATSTSDLALIVWMLERAKLEILRMADDNDESE